MKSLSKLKVEELKKELAARGLETSGLKAALISRLSKALEEEEKKNGTEAPEETNEEEPKEETSVKVEEEKTPEEAPEEVKSEDPVEEAKEVKEEIVENMEVDGNNEAEKSANDPASEEPFDETQLTIIDTYDSNAEDQSAETTKKRQRSPSPVLNFNQLYKRTAPEVKQAPVKVQVSSDDSVIASGNLDFKNADLNLVIDNSGLKAQNISNEGFEYMFAGARGSYGVTAGKVAFQVKLLSQIELALPTRESEKNAFRIGFSLPLSSLQLGEVAKSYGYANNGKKCTKSAFSDYGEAFAVDDTITGFLDLDKESEVEISFAKNGKDLGVAFTVPKTELEDGQALFPHVLTKNFSYEVNFGGNPDTLVAFPEKFAEFKAISSIPEDQKVPSPIGPEKKEDCEVIMMVGLPSSGKSTWALKHKEDNPDKLYNILSIDYVLEKMKVNGVERKRGFVGSNGSFIDKAYHCLEQLIDIAPNHARNYILDQHNVYSSSQARRLKKFEGFQRSAIVVVPSNDDFKKRVEKQNKELGKQHSESVISQMKASFVFPEEGPVFTSVTFAEVAKEEATELVKTYKEEAQKSNKRRRPSYEVDTHSSQRQKRYRAAERTRGNYRPSYNNRPPQRSPRYENVHERQFNRPPPFNRDRRHIEPWRPNYPNYMWNTRPAPYQNPYPNSGYRHY